MVSNNYIRVIYDSSGSNKTGKKLKINIEPLERSKGIQTADIPIPTLGSVNRILIPTSGLIDDFTLNCVLHDETGNDVAFDVNSSGVDSVDSSVHTIKEQWDYLFDEIAEVDTDDGGVFAIYELYTEWNDTTYEGWLKVQSAIDNEEYSGQVEFRLVFKKGKNPLGFLT